MDSTRPADAARKPVWAAALILVAAGLVAYANSFGVPFVFDDHLSVVENPTLHRISDALLPPRGQGITVEGRPILNLSLALNYAMGGLQPAGYHVVNLAIHLSAALLLFGVIRRTARRTRGTSLLAGDSSHPSPVGSTSSGPAAGGVAPSDGIAFAVALLWVVHPLETESVTYIVQRTESLMGMFFLLTIYALVRSMASATAATQRGWLVVSVASCALGMATKEVMVVAPIIVLLYDRTFVSGSVGAALHARRGYYAALGATWIVLALAVWSAGDRGGTIGAAAGVRPWQYALTQSRAIVHYLRLAVWPAPLVFDYGSDFVTPAEALPYLCIDTALLVAVAAGLRRRSAAAFIGATFFLVLAPTSSFLGGTRQMLAEHRMYLSLGAVLLLLILALYQFVGRRAVLASAALALGFVMLTVERNGAYRTELALWADAVAKRPGNAHAHYNLANLLAASGRRDAAIAEYREAVRLRPGLVGAENNLANELLAAGRADEAVAHWQAALKLKPDYAKAHYNLAGALRQMNRRPEALEHYLAAVRLAPNDLEAHDDCGALLLQLGRLEEAAEQFQAALRINANTAETHCNLGTVWLLQNKFAEAEAEYARALKLNPQLAAARNGLERARTGSGK